MRAPALGPSPDRTVVIANPAAGRGRALRMLPHVREALAARGVTSLRLTSRAGEERDIAEAETRSGADTIVALGGDGTWGNVARGIVAGGGTARLALLAAGTGNDLAWCSGIPAHQLDAALAIALGTSERRIDVGLANDVHFLNCLGFGFDAEVVQAASAVRWAGGHLVYVYAAVRQLFAFAGITERASMGEESRPAREERHLMLVVANGARFGGGFLIAPGARNDDGALDVVRVGDASPLRRIALLVGASRGRHVSAPEVSLSRATALSLDFDAPPLFQADGELHRSSTSHVSVTLLRSALRLAAPG